MAKQVRDTAAGQSISAYVVLNKKGQHVATVNAHFSNGGAVTVDVWNHGDAVYRCATAVGIEAPRGAGVDKAHDQFQLQQGRAGGYGYDKKAAALAGLWIDGHQLADHCGSVANAEKARANLMKAYSKFKPDGDAWNLTKPWDEKAKKIGARFANWMRDENRFGSLHFVAGLERLEMLGYTVIQAI